MKKKAPKKKAKAKAKKVVKQQCVHYWGWGMGTPTTEKLDWDRTPGQVEAGHNTKCTVCKKTWHDHASVYYCEFCCKRMGQSVGFPSSLD